jgi:hypothetical protein
MRATALIALLFAGVAAAQLRTIPADAQRAKLRHVEQNRIELDGKAAQLAPGAQIRDTSNRIVVPSAVPAGTLVKYRRDASGAVRQIWILTPEEAKR